MSRLFGILLPIAMSTLAGAGVIVALSAGYYDARAIVLAAAVGAILSIPVAWLTARKLLGLASSHKSS